MMHRSRTGFTIGELLVTVVVFGILASIALPSLGGLVQRLQLNQATEQLNAAVRQVRTLAMSKSRALTLRISATTPVTYCITAGADCSTGVLVSDRLPDNIAVALANGFDALPFDSQGYVGSGVSLQPTALPTATLTHTRNTALAARQVIVLSRLGKAGTL